jgi:hypothetical protein
MKNLFISLSILFLPLTNIQAQELSKSEKKALMSEIKALKKSPEKFVKMKENLEFSDIIVDQQIEIIAGLKKEAQITELSLNETKSKLESVETDLAKSKALIYNLDEFGASRAPMNHQGEKYRVQIGLYTNLDFSYLLDDPKFMVHEYLNGQHRYSVGNFNTEEEADAFKIEMRKLGIYGAFVSTYTDGRRTDNLTPKKNANISTKPDDKVEVTIVPKNSGFNVNTAKNTNSIESNPNRIENGTVISSKPVEVVPASPAKDQSAFQFKDESIQKSGIKINIAK